MLLYSPDDGVDEYDIKTNTETRSCMHSIMKKKWNAMKWHKFGILLCEMEIITIVLPIALRK